MRARLTLFASVSMALLSLLVTAFVLWAVHNTAVDYKRNQVLSTALRVVHLIKRGTLPPVLSSDLQGVQVVDPSGRIRSSTRNLLDQPRITRIEPDDDNANRSTEVCGLRVFPEQCEILVVLRVYQNDGDWLVYAFDHMVPWYVSPAVLAFLLVGSAALAAVTGIGVSHVVARTLAPVDHIRSRLAEITAGDQSMRVPVPDTDDEIRSLAVTANETLERLEQAIEQQRRFASDASHDLRSPITAMRAQLEDAMLHPEDADWQEMGEELLASLDRLQAIVTDLLTLAKLDAGAPGNLESVDLAELVAAETSRPRRKRVVTSLQPDVVVTGDRLRLARLLTNLLDNAERHAESTIIVTVRKNHQATLEVLDDGAGVAPEHREMVFRRFTRLDASRSRDAGGTGLGLPIAREIAEHHGGTLTIEDSDIGARFVLRIPLREERVP
ncbi:HAMP domain-containing sensor histidine kinase [Nonomuraea pusilla]|uniref:sensor histidine kinase n=1 Tax=Nonomuraea pusilla TaxID=46177 RepID=UPI0033206403